MTTVTVTGTATNFEGLYNALRDFLVNDVDLTNAGENWTQIYGVTGTLTVDDEIVLEGPGTTGTDTIRINLKPFYSVNDNRYNLGLRGLTSWNDTLVPDDQIGKSSFKYVTAWNGSMPYRFVASGRRFVIKLQVSTVFTAGYAGFIKQLATPSQYPYPCAIGGSTDTATTLYSSADIEHCHFINPHDSLILCFPDGVWRRFRNFYNASGTYAMQSDVAQIVAPWSNLGSSGVTADSGCWDDVSRIRQNLDGTYPLLRATLMSGLNSAAGPSVIGYLDGCYWVPGIANSADNILTQGGNTYEVVQNVFRTDNFRGYWALQLD